MDNRSTAESYLELPYARELIPDKESGQFSARIVEFPGCFAIGETAAEAYQELEAAARSWLESCFDQGLAIPEPLALQEPASGAVSLRMPRSLHRRAAELAKLDNVSLNQFLVAAIATRVGAADFAEKMLDRLGERLGGGPERVVSTIWSEDPKFGSRADRR